jgi:hypothetical protein
MNARIDLIKACIRPFIIVWGAILYGVCLIKGIAMPDMLVGLVAAFIVEYFGERAVFRFKENAADSDKKGES